VRRAVAILVAVAVAVAVVGVAAFVLGRETAPRDDVATVEQGDAFVVPTTATRCEASQEGGIPNLFCTRMSSGRYQVVFWRDEVQVYDLAAPHEPMEADYVVPATLNR